MEFLIKHVAIVATALCATVALTGCPANPIVVKSQHDQAAKVAQIPHCTRKLGTISVLEPDSAVNWWTGQQLPAPSKLIKVFVAKSGCFTLLDRGAGMGAAMRERALAGNGELRGGANVGKGQVKAADYIMVPDLVSSNRDAGGAGLSTLAQGLIGGNAGRVAGALNISSKTADVTLTVTDVRSSEQVALVEGHGEKNDLSFGANGSLFGANSAGAAGVGGYANTTVGQVITMAYLDAYTKLVEELGGLPGNASAANSRQAGTISKPAKMLANANGKGAVVRSLDPGMVVYPTGTKQGVMWEVEDEHGNRGWVSSTLFDLAR